MSINGITTVSLNIIRLKCKLLPPQKWPRLYLLVLYLAIKLGSFRLCWSIIFKFTGKYPQVIHRCNWFTESFPIFYWTLVYFLAPIIGQYWYWIYHYSFLALDIFYLRTIIFKYNDPNLYSTRIKSFTCHIFMIGIYI